MKLRNFIFLVSLPIVVISIIVVEQITYHYTKNELSKQLGNEIESTFSSLQQTTHQILDLSSSNLVLYGSFEVFERYLKYKQYGLSEEAEITKQEIRNTFKRLIDLKNEYVAIGFIDETKKAITHYSQYKDYVVGDFEKLKLHSTNKINLFVSDVFFRDDKPMVRIAYQIMPRGIGYLFLDMDCNSMLSAMQQTYLFTKGDIYFVDQKNDLFFVTTSTQRDVAIKILGKMKLLSNNVTKNKNGFYEFDRQYLFSNLYPLDDFGWSMGFVIKKNAIYGHLDKMQKYGLLIIVFAVLGMFLIIVVLSSRISKPIEFILNDISKIATGELYEHSLNRRFHVKEISLIQHEIDKMREKLRGLKRKIIEDASFAAIGQSTAMVAHDVRRPLASMKSLLTVLPSIKDNPLEVEKMITAVDDNIRRTNTMLNDILEFSRDSTALKLDNHNPQSIITSALSEAFRVHPDSDIKVSYNLQHKDCLRVDGDRIIRVLVNIIDNALDAMTNGGGKASGRIWVETSSRSSVVDCRSQTKMNNPNFITIKIGNDGPAIPDDVVGKLFDPFFTHGKKGGTGLGLAICRKVIEMHGGKIEARNTKQEAGSMNQEKEGVYPSSGSVEFTIELPAKEGNLAINEADLIYNSSEFKAFHREEAARPSISDITTMAEFMRINKERGRLSYMLIVDDEPLFRETVRSLLNNLEQVRDHVKVVEAGAAEDALKLFDKQLFDYLITDIDLGKLRMNGYEFAQVILEKYPNTYVLIHSNKRKDELDQQIRQIANCRHCEELVSNKVVIPAEAGIQRIKGDSRFRGNDNQGTRFMGFLPKPMKSSELLQFLACKTFETSTKQETRSRKHETGSTKQEVSATNASAGSRITNHESRVTKNVLVVNDDESLTFSIGFSLKNYNVQVLTASNVSEALTHLTNNDVDIILSDINLGNDKPSGYDLLKKVREEDKDKPFYFMSGFSKSEEWPKAKSLGANGYLQIPIEDEELEEIL